MGSDDHTRCRGGGVSLSDQGAHGPKVYPPTINEHFIALVHYHQNTGAFLRWRGRLISVFGDVDVEGVFSNKRRGYNKEDQHNEHHVQHGRQIDFGLIFGFLMFVFSTTHRYVSKKAGGFVHAPGILLSPGSLALKPLMRLRALLTQSRAQAYQLFILPQNRVLCANLVIGPFRAENSPLTPVGARFNLITPATALFRAGDNPQFNLLWVLRSADGSVMQIFTPDIFGIKVPIKNYVGIGLFCGLWRGGG